jgi:hypothetical protein
VEQPDVERIARATLKELGISGAQLLVRPVEGQPGQWRMDIDGVPGTAVALRVTWGQGSTPQSIRAQIFEQYLR